MQQLLQRIEQQVGRQMRTPKDFRYLSEEIFRQLHQTLSPSTLKRLWGYFPSVQQPRPFTLDLLCRFAESPKRGIISKGHTFGSVGEYLHLFGVCNGISIPPTYWSQPLPGSLGIILWGPEYQHPEWHNLGDPSQLMPTITEYWTPTADGPCDSGIASARNADNYLRATSFHELRITFMKNLTSEGYTFLGIYRLAPESSPQRLVWQRVADRLDLQHLEALEQLRDR